MIEYLQKKCQVLAVDGQQLCAEFGSSKYLNVILLGVAAGSGVLDISKEAIQKEIRVRVPSKFVENNRLAFEKGYAFASGQAQTAK